MVSQIVERIRKKDQRAMSELYQMYVGELTSVCYRYIPNADDAKDVLQNSFVKIFTSIPTLEYRGDEQFKGWLVRIVANEALMFLRNKKKLLFVEQNETADEIDEDSIQIIYVKNGIFNSVTPENTNDLRKQTKKAKEKSILESDMLDQADENAISQITTLLNSVYPDLDVEVVVK